jgi:hypothetical protein
MGLNIVRHTRFGGWIVRATVGAGVVLSAAFFSGCEDSPFVAPTGTGITLAAAGTIPANGFTDITALLLRGGFGVGSDSSGAVTKGVGPPVKDDTVVSFLTTLGHIEPSEAKTKDGQVTVTLFGGGVAGTAKVTAFSGSASSTIDITLTATAQSSR